MYLGRVQVRSCIARPAGKGILEIARGDGRARGVYSGKRDFLLSLYIRQVRTGEGRPARLRSNRIRKADLQASRACEEFRALQFYGLSTQVQEFHRKMLVCATLLEPG
jgi:hypothetical protein